jgi:nucleoside 2-deoxyribosyltransferase
MKKSAKIYCAGPIRGDVFHVEYYYQIVSLVWQLGHLPLTELALSESQASAASDVDIYLRDMRWLQEADALIAEISGPSLGVGYEIAYALHNLNIPVLCVHRRSAKTPSAMISGNRSERLMVRTYDSDQELERIVREFLESIESSDGGRQ